MVLVTGTGLRTYLGWWTRMSVLGRAIVLVGAGDESDAELVVAEEASVEEAMSLLDVIEDRIRLRARRFDTRSWNGDAGVNTSSPGVGSAGERGGVSVGRLMREEIVGWNHDTLVRLLWDGDVVEIEVVPKEPTAGSRNRVADSWKALRGRPGGTGFDLTSEVDYLRFRTAVEELIPRDSAASTDVLTPGEATSQQCVPTACTEGCILSVRAYSGDEDDAGWISIDLISNARTRRDGSLRGRLANAIGASLGHIGGAAWCPLPTPAALRSALASACSVAFPNLEDASSVPRRGIAEAKDNGKD